MVTTPDLDAIGKKSLLNPLDCLIIVVITVLITRPFFCFKSSKSLFESSKKGPKFSFELLGPFRINSKIGHILGLKPSFCEIGFHMCSDRPRNNVGLGSRESLPDVAFLARCYCETAHWLVSTDLFARRGVVSSRRKAQWILSNAFWALVLLLNIFKCYRVLWNAIKCNQMLPNIIICDEIILNDIRHYVATLNFLQVFCHRAFERPSLAG